MRFEDLKNLSQSRADHPSDFSLDCLVNGDLSPEDARSAEQHCEGCDVCAAKLAEFRLGFAAMPEFDQHRALGRLRTHLASTPPSRSWFERWRIRPLFWVAPVAATLGALFLLLTHKDSALDADLVEGPRDTTRLKGNLRLDVVRKTPDGSAEMVSGDVFHASDRLRFRVTLPRRGRIAIVGVEASGELYTAWPLPEHHANPLLDRTEKHLLPGAVQLDGKPGEEILHLVFCPPEFTPECRSTGPKTPPRCGEPCTSTRFTIRKR